jgi:hypothetical protein
MTSPRISVVKGATTDMLRRLSALGMEMTTQGRTLATWPKSTRTTSPRLKLVIKDGWSRSELIPGFRRRLREIRVLG